MNRAMLRMKCVTGSAASAELPYALYSQKPKAALERLLSCKDFGVAVHHHTMSDPDSLDTFIANAKDAR